MPVTDVDAVVTLSRVAGSGTEVGVVAGGVDILVLVVADRRVRDVLESTPAEVVGLVELAQRPVLVLVVTEDESGGWRHAEHKI